MQEWEESQISSMYNYVLRITKEKLTKENKALNEDETRALNKIRRGTQRPPHSLKGKIKSNHVPGRTEWQILPDKGSPSILQKKRKEIS